MLCAGDEDMTRWLIDNYPKIGDIANANGDLAVHFAAAQGTGSLQFCENTSIFLVHIGVKESQTTMPASIECVYCRGDCCQCVPLHTKPMLQIPRDVQSHS